MRNRLKKIFIYLFLYIILSFSYSAFKGYLFYKSIFRLSYEEIHTSLEKTPTQCKKFKDCKLLPGDIFVRRYVTNFTDVVDVMFNPYFLHSAIYLGNDEMFEVWGSREPLENQIVISKLSKSDWLNNDMTNFVIFRPKNYYGKLDKIISEFKNIANDPDYVYGTYNEKNKKASCADVILKKLEGDGILTKSQNEPRIITPDYLFWAIKNDGSNFDVIGYNIRPREVRDAGLIDMLEQITHDKNVI